MLAAGGVAKERWSWNCLLESRAHGSSLPSGRSRITSASRWETNLVLPLPSSVISGRWVELPSALACFAVNVGLLIRTPQELSGSAESPGSCESFHQQLSLCCSCSSLHSHCYACVSWHILEMSCCLHLTNWRGGGEKERKNVSRAVVHKFSVP